MINYKTIAESNNFIVLDKYSKEWKVAKATKAKATWSASLFRIWSIRAMNTCPA
jgi:type I restriction enzyme, R subunit